MHKIIYCLFLFVVALECAPQNVFNFEIPKQGKKLRVEGFSYKDCGGNNILLHSLSVTPDPLKFPGTATIGFNATVRTLLQSQLKLSLLIEKEVLGRYIKIPCIDNFGSCTYRDLCAILDNIDSCPDPLVKAGIPCECPYKAGGYNLPSVDIEEDDIPLPTGGYHAQVNITVGDQLAGCMDLHVSVA